MTASLWRSLFQRPAARHHGGDGFEPPITAILAAESWRDAGWTCCTAFSRHTIRKAGASPTRRCWKRWRKSCLPSAAFIAEMRFSSGADRATHRGKPGAAGQSARPGLPTFALQDSEGRLRLLPAGNYLGNVEAWKNLLGAARWRNHLSRPGCRAGHRPARTALPPARCDRTRNPPRVHLQRLLTKLQRDVADLRAFESC